MESKQIADFANLYQSIYREKTEEEQISEIASEYFYNQGLNEDDIDILIEDIGIDNFIDMVSNLTEETHLLSEARRSAERIPGGKGEKTGRLDKGTLKFSGDDAYQKAKEKQSKKALNQEPDKEKESIAKKILDKFKSLARKSKKVAKKAVDAAKDGKRRLMGEEVYDIICSYLLDEGYVTTEEAANNIMVNMSEQWRQSILEDAPLRDEPLWGPKPRKEPLWGPKPTTVVKKPVPKVVQKKPVPVPSKVQTTAPNRDEPLW